mmetsp:Transcript_26527/g.67989  ORF Transcript_26527/g.67989 Transcript_26527/m.67989 type:complete len:259 (-) Transcript_26527:1014-1790(-)
MRNNLALTRRSTPSDLILPFYHSEISTSRTQSRQLRFRQRSLVHDIPVAVFSFTIPLFFTNSTVRYGTNQKKLEAVLGDRRPVTHRRLPLYFCIVRRHVRNRYCSWRIWGTCSCLEEYWFAPFAPPNRICTGNAHAIVTSTIQLFQAKVCWRSHHVHMYVHFHINNVGTRTIVQYSITQHLARSRFRQLLQHFNFILEHISPVAGWLNPRQRCMCTSNRFHNKAKYFRRHVWICNNKQRLAPLPISNLVGAPGTYFVT